MTRSMWAVAIAAAVLTITPALAQTPGQTFNAGIRGTQYDPTRLTNSLSARQAFDETLSGPQTPSRPVVLGSTRLVVYETCAAHMCAYVRGVTVIDTQTREVFSVVFNDNGRRVIVPNRRIEALIGRSCDSVECDLPTAPVSVTRGTNMGVLTSADLASQQGGASCIATDERNRRIFYTDGNAIMRYAGRLRRLRESQGGIGGDMLTSEDGGVPMVVTFVDRGRARTGYESAITPRVMTVQLGSTAENYNVTVRCES